MNYFEEKEIENYNSSNKQNQLLINENEELRKIISELEQSKNQLIYSSNEEKEYIVSERIEFEKMYDEVNRQKNNLETEYNKTKLCLNQKVRDLEDELKNFKEIKEKEREQFQNNINKIKKENENLLKEKSKYDSLDKKYSQMIIDIKSKYENEKNEKEIIVKSEVEKKTYINKITNLTEKSEEMRNIVKELQNKLNKKSSEISLEKILEEDSKKEMSNDLILKQKKIDDLNQKIRNFQKEINEVRRLEAEKEFLVNNCKTLSKQLEKIKNQREKDKIYFQNELKNANEEAGKVKCLLANVEFNKDNEILKWKKYVKKIQDKLNKMGIQVIKKHK